MECEIKRTWIQGYIQALFDHTTLCEFTKGEKLARKSWRSNCEDLTWEKSPAPVDDVLDFELAA